MTVDLWYTSVISYLAKRPARDLIVAAHQELTLAALLEMEVDPIIEEVRRIRQEYAKRFGYDLCAVAADVRRREQQHPGRLVSFPPRPVPVRGELSERAESEAAIVEEGVSTALPFLRDSLPF